MDSSDPVKLLGAESGAKVDSSTVFSYGSVERKTEVPAGEYGEVASGARVFMAAGPLKIGCRCGGSGSSSSALFCPETLNVFQVFFSWKGYCSQPCA